MSIIFQRLITFTPQEINFMCLEIKLFVYNTGEFANCLHVNKLRFAIKKRIKVIQIKQKLRKF